MTVTAKTTLALATTAAALAGAGGGGARIAVAPQNTKAPAVTGSALVKSTSRPAPQT